MLRQHSDRYQYEADPVSRPQVPQRHSPLLLNPALQHNTNTTILVHETPRWHRRCNHSLKSLSMSSCSSSATHPSGRAACCSASPISSGCRRTKRAQRSGLTFGCACNLLSFSFIVLTVDDDGYGLRCGCVGCCGITILGTQIGGSGTEGQDEYMGALLLFPLFSLPWILPPPAAASRLGKGQTLR